MRLSQVLVAVSISLLAGRVDAAPIVFTDRAAFEATVRPNLLVEFNAFEPILSGEFCPFEASPSCLGIVDDVLVLVTSDDFAFDAFGGDLTLWEPFGYINANLQPFQAFTAIGFDVAHHLPPADRFAQVGFSDDMDREFVYEISGTPAFLGFVFPDTPMRTVQFLAGQCCEEPSGPIVAFDNIVFRTVPVPEPSTLLLFGSTLALMTIRHFRH
jgi:PEP-CTERM motif